ncbi:MAG: hypothetical protein COA69_07060 [Robiginitomaculum sp.]|nr:MAG: hypothetical protein COA69_07060 [Robiginitomaculum sp.]
MCKLHHMGESTCSQRVRLALAEKELEWESLLVAPTDLRSPLYLALNPAGVVPTLEHGSAIISESRLICEYLEDVVPQKPLLPLMPIERYKVRCWTKLFDDKLHLAIFVLSFMVWMRPRYESMPPDVRQMALPGLKDPVKRRVSEDMLVNGWDSVVVKTALTQMMETICALQDTLSDQRWLGGDHYSLADIDLFCIAQRLDDLGLCSLWDEFAAVADWIDRSRGRKSFKAAFTNWRNDEIISSNRLKAETSADSFLTILATL